MTKKNLKIIFLLHILLMVYSMSEICSKKASEFEFLSPMFILYYSIIILLLGLYAIGWQQIIKRLPLTTAYANKAITIFWGVVWGMLFFNETITIGKIVGVIIVIIGVVLFVLSDRGTNNE